MAAPAAVASAYHSNIHTHTSIGMEFHQADYVSLGIPSPIDDMTDRLAAPSELDQTVALTQHEGQHHRQACPSGSLLKSAVVDQPTMDAAEQWLTLLLNAEVIPYWVSTTVAAKTSASAAPAAAAVAAAVSAALVSNARA